MSHAFKRFWQEEDGATMVEYGLMLALIAVVCIVIVTALGQEVAQSFFDTGDAINDATPGTAAAPADPPDPTWP